jgi:hypothetical protein
LLVFAHRATKIFGFHPRRFLYFVPECEKYPSPELGTELEKRIAALPVFQKLSGEGFSMLTQGKSL